MDSFGFGLLSNTTPGFECYGLFLSHPSVFIFSDVLFTLKFKMFF